MITALIGDDDPQDLQQYQKEEIMAGIRSRWARGNGLIDLGADTTTQIAATGYPVGWAPDNGPLVLSSVYGSTIGQGPYTLSAVTCTSSLQCSSTALTERAMTFAFLGFMRNP